MLRFLIKGVFRDRSRSLFSLIVITLIVALTVFIRGFMAGIFDDVFRQSAVIFAGHVKVTTQAYTKEADLLPNDLAILGADSLVAALAQQYPEMFWSSRIMFAGLLDVPDEYGETKEQGPMLGFGVDLFSPESRMLEIWELERKIVRGRLPEEPGEVLLGETFATRLGVEPGEVATFIGASMYGGFVTYNFDVAGTISLGVTGIDKNILIADLQGVRQALDMQDAAGEIVGYSHDMFYDDPASVALAADFNVNVDDPDNEFSLFMQPLRDHTQMGAMVDIAGYMMGIVILVFVAVTVLVLWNLGLMNGLRRYGEFGMRLAMGETKGHVYRTTMGEAVVMGIVGSFIGTVVAVPLIWYLQEVGLDYTGLFEDMTFVVSNIIRARLTPDCYYLGFIPGVVATVAGTMLAGRGIYKREMSQLFKELELEA
ncbi:MAG: ABC transporter permease [Fidelibacterota bacterium]|nr:MAG: ABC transporter permease [Candidatus Neomarinimicrobiota bacterium]